MSSPLARVAEVLRDDGGLLAATVPDPLPTPLEDALGRLAASGPRGEGGRGDALALAVEATREGYLLHHGPGGGRVVRTDDADLALLAGDRLYALGLAVLADLGDLDAIAELADVIALSAHAHAAADPDLAEAVWEAGVRAIGWGPTPDHGAAKQAAREGVPSAASALRTSARRGALRSA